ncbi:hemolysin III family protein [Romboutsia ilealis]|uniref:Hemolysin III family protein n=1 Tax=Romboutsia faecis TaxID=2764597 RepID=A0ABR7JNI9_9FIRM|nr:hemolysin III family protein [Romboutsia faecis]MBC5996156.1 hemolysin III family protein [Romboutsia faecis]MRN23356.1 hemolysin III family protein [Romboutsia ilealis]
MKEYIREPINGFTHLGGAILSFVGLLALVIKTTLTSPFVVDIAAVIIFGISLMLLYSASATYHLVIASEKIIAFLRKIDHSMIFILIAGSYTPFCLIGLKGVYGGVAFSIVATIAVCGVLFKMVWFKCPRWISTSIYIGMGWISIFLIKPLLYSIPFEGVLLLVLGGIFYTIGAIIYGIKPESLKFKSLGFHEIFHIFILLGSLCHFFSVYEYVI